MEPLSNASCCSVFYPDRGLQNKFSIEVGNIPEPNWGKCPHYIKHEGFYVFGGQKADKTVADQFFIISLCPKPEILKPETKGKSPPE